VPILIFLCAFLGAYFLVCLLRAILRAVAWCVGYCFGLVHSVLEGKPLRALAAFVAVLCVVIAISR